MSNGCVINVHVCACPMVVYHFVINVHLNGTVLCVFLLSMHSSVSYVTAPVDNIHVTERYIISR